MLKHKQAAVPYRATAATRAATGNVNQAYSSSPENEAVFYISDDLRPYNFNTLTAAAQNNPNSFSRYNPHPGTHRNFSNVVCTPGLVQQPTDLNSFGKSVSIPNRLDFNLNSSASLINNFSNEDFGNTSTNYHHARVEAPVPPRHHGSQLNKNSKTSQTQVSLISSSSRSSPPVSQSSSSSSSTPHQTRPVAKSAVIKTSSICNRKCIVVALIVVALVCIIGIVAGVTFVVINLNSNQQQDTNKQQFQQNSPVMDPSSSSTADDLGVKRPTASSASTLAPMKEMNPGSQFAGALNADLEPTTCGQQAIKPFQKYLRIINGKEAVSELASCLKAELLVEVSSRVKIFAFRFHTLGLGWRQSPILGLEAPYLTPVELCS